MSEATVTDEHLAQYVGYWTNEMTEFIKRNDRLRPYLSRLQTRLIVTNKTDAHLAPDVPQDIAIFYYLPEVDDAHLELWRNSIIDAWMEAILQGHDMYPLTGRRGLLKTRYPVRSWPAQLNAFKRDQLYQKGYNMVRVPPGIGPLIDGHLIWRHGKIVQPQFGPPEEVYKYIATPLALME
jgi:hypothetical protein